MSKNIPYISPEFLSWFEEQFGSEMPEAMPEDPRQYDYLAGRQSVVNSVRRIATRQEGTLEDY